MLFKTYLSKLAVLLVFALIMAGCSISVSSDSISTSSDSVSTILTSPSTASGSSSNGDGGDDEEEKKVEQTTTLYEEDIAALTVLYLKQEKGDDEFKRQIADVAVSHGINDWEQEESTFTAMGIGLKRAGVAEKAIQETTYFKNLATSDYKLVMEGYQN